MKNTLIVNLFGGPGCGKSTMAAYLFYKLKSFGIDCEYVTEFAKDKIWEGNKEVFNCQFYITGKQIFKIQRCFGKVDVIITDSPIPTGIQYTDNTNLKLAILDEFKKYGKNNFNILLNRVHQYVQNGRNQTEEESIEIDKSFQKWLETNEIEYVKVDSNENGYNEIIKMILDKIKENE